jgi:hypothetical protein
MVKGKVHFYSTYNCNIKIYNIPKNIYISLLLCIGRCDYCYIFYCKNVFLYWVNHNIPIFMYNVPKSPEMFHESV